MSRVMDDKKQSQPVIDAEYERVKSLTLKKFNENIEQAETYLVFARLDGMSESEIDEQLKEYYFNLHKFEPKTFRDFELCLMIFFDNLFFNDPEAPIPSTIIKMLKNIDPSWLSYRKEIFDFLSKNKEE